MDGRTWWAAVHGVDKSRTRLSDFTFTFHSHASEKEMATHSSVLAWRIPGTGEPGGLPSVGLHRVGHDCSDLAAAGFKRLLLGRKVMINLDSILKSRDFTFLTKVHIVKIMFCFVFQYSCTDVRIRP